MAKKIIELHDFWLSYILKGYVDNLNKYIYIFKNLYIFE